MFKLSKEESDRIKFTKQQIIEAKEILKSEFFGIDKQIDEICDNVLDYITFNKFQKTPLIINLWGMTGCGKTSLINRLLELLSFSKIYFNFANVSEKSSYETQEYLEEQLLGRKNEGNLNFIVYDEFQYARTIDSKGQEVDKPSMKIFWELLDSGKFSLHYDWSTVFNLKRAYHKLSKIMFDDDIEIEFGQITKGENKWKYIIGDFVEHEKKFKEEIDEKIIKELYLTKEDIEKKVIFSEGARIAFLNVLKRNFPNEYMCVQDVNKKILTLKNKTDLFEFITNTYMLVNQGKINDFSNSCIFVIGNLDEAYKISGDKNPDMSANQFHEYTLTLNTVSVKEALGKRFRDEQIARLGNIHLLYPSFNEDTYRKIIKRYLDIYKKDVENEFNIKIDFNKNIYEIIYKDGVFPTQGTRPLFSTISEIVKTKLSHIITYAIENNISFNKLEYVVDGKNICINYYNDDQFLDVKCFEQVLRVENNRHTRNKNFQMLCAVHETGHALLNLMRFNELPEKLYSVTLGEGIGGFLLRKFDKSRILNYNNLISTLSVSMAGRAAEEIVFGIDNITSGASSDLRNATDIAVTAIRKYGFGDILAVNDWFRGGLMSENMVYDKERGDELIIGLINKSHDLAKESLKEQEVLLYHISKYLSTKNTISTKKFKELVSKYYVGELPSIIKNKKKENSLYIDLFNNKFQNI